MTEPVSKDGGHEEQPFTSSSSSGPAKPIVRSNSPYLPLRVLSSTHLQRSVSDSSSNSSLNSCFSGVSSTSSRQSDVSSLSSQSSISTSASTPPFSRSVSSSAASNRRRGFMKPQTTAFAESARCRESVMSLGTIAHIQHYFARTGLLDGKGGQLSKDKVKKTLGDDNINSSASTTIHSCDPGLESTSGLGPCLEIESGDLSANGSKVKSSAQNEGFGVDDEGEWNYQDHFMLPPTVSTYNHRLPNGSPLQAPKMLQQTLEESLEDSRKLMDELKSTSQDIGTDAEDADKIQSGSNMDSLGWLEIQGLRLLDVFTLTISAAKNYYTAHEDPQRLYSIKAERELRRELYEVLELLRAMAVRDFRGGVRDIEFDKLQAWLDCVEAILKAEKSLEETERKKREGWIWRFGDWSGREREREWLFLSSFDTEVPTIPPWPDEVLLDEDGNSNGNDTAEPNDFLKFLQNGLRLVLLHNRFVELSRRRFEMIKYYHTDFAKPYRSAENLRYWVKAAQLRWDIKLELNVMAVVRGEDAGAMKQFDDAILTWSQGVRKQIVSAWEEENQ